MRSTKTPSATKERKIVSFRSEMSSYLVKNSASVEAEMVRKRCEQVLAAGGSFTMNQRALPDGHVSCTFTLMVPVYEN